MATERNNDTHKASSGTTQGAKTSVATKRTAQTAVKSEHEEDKSSSTGRGWHGDPEGHAAAGRKGGQKVAKDRDHMASIGRKGGEAVSRDRQHMAEIGRKGGQSRSETTPTENAR